MYRISLVLFALALVLLNGGCTGASGNAAGAAKVFSIDGVDYTAEELLKSPFIRAGLTQQIMYSSMKAELQKRGIKPDTTEIDRRMEETKAQIEGSGQSWTDYLATSGMKEDDLRQRMQAEMEWKALIDSMVNVTEEDVTSKWEQQQEMFVEQYMREHHLPDTERANVTLEDARYLIEEYIKNEQNFENQQSLMQELTDNTEFQILCFKDAKEADLYEYLIYNNRKTKTEGEAGAETGRDTGAGATAAGSAPEAEAGSEAAPEEGAEGGAEAQPEGESTEGGEAAGDAGAAEEGAAEGGQ
jgi:hypothetical protein